MGHLNSHRWRGAVLPRYGSEPMRAVWVGAVAVLAASAALAMAQQTAGIAWISAGTTGVLPAQAEFATPTGRVGLFLSEGPIEM